MTRSSRWQVRPAHRRRNKRLLAQLKSGRTKPWYSITLTNYQTKANREGFNQLIAFLASNMARRFGARPHWGKLFPLALSEARELYPAFDDFRRVCVRSDPNHAFSNEWTGELLQ